MNKIKCVKNRRGRNERVSLNRKFNKLGKISDWRNVRPLPIFNKKFLIIFALFSVIAVSGCVNQLQGIIPFGSDVVKPNRQTATVGTANPITISKVWTLPDRRVPAGADLKMFVEISNQDKDPFKEVKNLFVDLFDASIFKDPVEVEYCNTIRGRSIGYVTQDLETKDYYQFACSETTEQQVFGGARRTGSYTGCLPNECDINRCCNLKVGATRQVTFNLKAPSETEIAKVSTKGKLSYLVQYDYQGSTNYEIFMVTNEEILNRQQAGETLSQPLQDVKGSGPIRIDVDQLSPFVTPGQDAFIIFKIRDVGSGSLKGLTIKKEQLTFEFPKDLLREDPKAIEWPSEFFCDLASASSVVPCTNREKEIKLFRGASEPIHFTIKTNTRLDAPYRSFFVNAKVDYTYELRGSAEAEVFPFS